MSKSNHISLFILRVLYLESSFFFKIFGTTIALLELRL